MTTHNLTELKRLFEEACQTTPPSVVLAYLFNGHSIHKAKTSLIRATRVIENSRVHVSPPQSSFSDELFSLGERIDALKSGEVRPSIHHE